MRLYLDTEWADLNKLLGVKVVVVTEGGLRDFMRDRVLREARPL